MRRRWRCWRPCSRRSLGARRLRRRRARPSTGDGGPRRRIEVTFEGDTVDAQRRAGRASTSASRSSWSSTPTRPASSTCTATPEQELEYDAGTTDARARPSTSPASSTSSRHDSTWSSSSSKSAERAGRLDARPTGIGGAKDLPIPLELAIAGAVAALVISFTVLAIAWREPRYDAATSGRPAPAWLDRLVVARARWPSPLRVLGLAFFLYVAAGRGLRPGPADQPVLRHRSTCCSWVGLVPRVAAARPGLARRSARSARSTAASPGVSGSDPRARACYAYPERLGYWPAALGLFAFVWLELVYPHSHRARPGPAVVRGLPRAHAHRRRAVRQHVLRARRPVRGLLLAGRQAVGLGPPRRRGCVRPQPAGQPRHRRSAPGPGRRWWRCCSAARRSTRSATRRPWLKLVQSTSTSRRPARQPRAARLLRRASALIFAVGDDGHRRRAERHRRGGRCPTCSRTRSCRSSSATSSPTT